MCGLVGIIANRRVSQDIYDALTILQHRGQDAAGIMTADAQRLFLRKHNGLVRDAIQESHMLKLRGNLGLGHVRYPTAGSDSPEESQPFYVNSPYGLGLVHNGNLTNTEQLTNDIIKTDLRHLNTSSDSEVLLNVIAYELGRTAASELTPDDLFKAMRSVYKRVQGAYSAVMLINGFGLMGFRDPQGIRPLVYGKRKTEKGPEYMLASESIALDALGFELVDDVKPGEVIYFDLQGKVHKQICSEQTQFNPCIFEFVYLARHDSILDGISIYQARLNMGRELAKKIAKSSWGNEIDVVVPIPDTSRVYATSLAQELGKHYSEGFIKNRYIGRTFIMPDQANRKNSVRLKLNAIKQEFANKNVLLVDDSIVRGTTSKEIVQMARDAGAKKVFFASAAPEVRYPNVYGIDMPTVDELVAHGRDLTQIAQKIGVDELMYLDLASVYAAINAAVTERGQSIKKFEDSIFTGIYPCGQIDQAYLMRIARLRNDGAKSRSRVAEL